MTKNKMLGFSLAHAVGAMAYISAVAWFFTNMEKLLGADGKPDNIGAPIAILSLLVFSVAVMGVLIFGRPVMLYLDNQKKASH